MKRPLLVVTIGYIIGIIMGVYLKISMLLIIFIICILFMIVGRIIIKTKFNWAYFYLVMIAVTCSCVNVRMLNNKYERLYTQNGNNMCITGTVCGSIKETENKYAVPIKLNKNIKLMLYVSKKQGLNLKYGNKIITTGTYKEPAGRRNYEGYDYKKYLKTKGIYGTVEIDEDIKITKKYNANLLFIIVNNLADKLKKNVYKLLPENTSSLASGILLGNGGDIENDMKKTFKQCNLSHMLAVSGTHLSYVILGVNLLLNKRIFGIRNCKIIAIFIIIVFMIITNMSPSVVRAGISAIILVLSSLIYRKQDTYTTIAVSLLAMLIYNPFLLFNMGLQLSYLATVSIIIFYPKLYNRCNRTNINKFGTYIFSNILLTISANILILPMTIYNFNTIPLNSIISNLLISPALGFCIILGLFMLIMSIIIFPIAKLIAIPLNILLTLIVRITEGISKLSFGSFTVVTPSVISIFLVYLSITAGLLQKKRLAKLFVVCIIVIYVSSSLTKYINLDNKLKIYFVDVGQGDCSLICSPKGKNILIDGGGNQNPDKYNIGEKVLLPYLLDRRIKTLEYVMFSHFDSDHCGALLYIMNEVKVKNVIIGRQYESCNNYEEFLKIVKKKKINVKVVEAGDKINIQKDLIFEVLWPDKNNMISENAINNNSLVCKLIYKEFSMLFTGDIEKIAEEAILGKYSKGKLTNTKIEKLHATVLKVAHHRFEKFIN